MNTTSIAVILVLIVTVGVYIGISGLATQYGVDTSGSQAGQIACAPNLSSIPVGQSVRWSASGLQTGTVYHWSSDDGRSETLADGRLFATYPTPGEKTVSLFYADGSRWLRTTCTVKVQ